MAEESAAGGAMWALVTLLIVLIVVGALYFGGAFSQKKSVDINIKTPGLMLLMAEGSGSHGVIRAASNRLA